MAQHRSVWRAPGRVNLIGEHTDYNGGFALPFAIEASCTAFVEPIAGDEVVVTSAQRAGEVRAPLAALAPGDPDWARYVLGVVWAAQQRGHRLPGLWIRVDSSVPSGAGLASSAALVCSIAVAVDDVLGLRLPADELLAITRSAENDFVGAPTGGLDQLAALRSTAGHALLCDMRSLSTRPVPLDLDAAGLALLVIDTGVRHSNATSAYGVRRAGCAAAADRLGVASLREVGPDDLADLGRRLPDETLLGYVRHVVTENDRVLRVAALLDAGDARSTGPLLSASHASLRDEYRVSVPELDVAVDAAVSAGAHGARMTGGGFGGSVIALVDAGLADACVAAVGAAFAKNGWAAPTALRARPMPGVTRIG